MKKFRDRDSKVREHYILSLGIMNDAEFKEFQQRVHDLPQDQRIAYCERSGRIVEVPADIPRKKASVGDIREQVPKKARKIKKAPKEIEKEIVSDRPEKQPVVIKAQKVPGIDVSRLKTRGAKIRAINKRIQWIKEDITMFKKISLQKAKVKGYSRLEEANIQRERRYAINRIDAGEKAINILKKQRSEVR